MTESRISATDRLRREGRWEEASLYRDEIRKQLKAEGRSRADANDAAWHAMLLKYPPLEPAQNDDFATDDWDADSLPRP